MASTPEASTDTYCFEMMSLVLALSGSSVGRTHLASQYAFVKDLLTLLHTATGRIQRQVIGKWILHIVAQCRNYRKILSDALFLLKLTTLEMSLQLHVFLSLINRVHLVL